MGMLTHSYHCSGFHDIDEAVNKELEKSQHVHSSWSKKYIFILVAIKANAKTIEEKNLKRRRSKKLAYPLFFGVFLHKGI